MLSILCQYIMSSSIEENTFVGGLDIESVDRLQEDDINILILLQPFLLSVAYNIYQYH